MFRRRSIPLIDNHFDQFLTELEGKYLNPNKVLIKWDDLYFNLGRGVQSFYVFGDGFSYHDMGSSNEYSKFFLI